MRPTRRGYGALAVAAGAVVVALIGGSQGRSLEAVAGPLFVAVAAGAIQVRRAGQPTVERSEPRRGFPGESRTVTLDVDGGGVAAITDRVGDGVSGGGTCQRTLPASVAYAVTYEARGVHSLGPATVRVRDALGLVGATYEVGPSTDVLVFPRVYAVGDAWSIARGGRETDHRTAFDRLREYQHGDSLRDVHWKTSAKYGDLLVAEFADPSSRESLAVAATCEPGHADAMAAAAATVFLAAVDRDVAVRLAVPAGVLDHDRGGAHRRRGLELLARTGAGTVADAEWDGADVRVRAGEGGVSVETDEQVTDFGDLTAGPATPAETEVRP